MSAGTDLGVRADHLAGRLIELGQRLDTDDRADLCAIVGELSDLLRHAGVLLEVER